MNDVLKKATEKTVVLQDKVDACRNRLKVARDAGHTGRVKMEKRNLKNWKAKLKVATKKAVALQTNDKALTKKENGPGFFNRLGNMTLKRAVSYLLFGTLLTGTGIVAVSYVKARGGKDEAIEAAVDAV